MGKPRLASARNPAQRLAIEVRPWEGSLKQKLERERRRWLVRSRPAASGEGVCRLPTYALQGGTDDSDGDDAVQKSAVELALAESTRRTGLVVWMVVAARVRRVDGAWRGDLA